MIQNLPPQARTPALLDALCALWEASVRESHPFLRQAQILRLRPAVRETLAGLPHLSVLRLGGRPAGMIGLDGERIVFFLLEPESTGRGYGRKLLESIRELPAGREICLFEENVRGRMICEHFGFRPILRREQDGPGADHPVLTLRRDLPGKADVRLARPEDLMQIEAIYESARKFMRENGNPDQWGDNYPASSLLLEDIQRGELYVIAAQPPGHLIDGVFMLSLRGEPTYARIDGSWTTSRPWGVIHRIASRPGARGILRTACAYASRLAPALRIDTHEDNHVMQERILREGFRRSGIITLEDGSPRIAYERGNAGGRA